MDVITQGDCLLALMGDAALEMVGDGLGGASNVAIS